MACLRALFSLRILCTMEGHQGWLVKKAVRTLKKQNWKKRFVRLRKVGDGYQLSYAKNVHSDPIMTLAIAKQSTVRRSDKFKCPELELVLEKHTFYGMWIFWSLRQAGPWWRRSEARGTTAIARAWRQPL